MNIHIPPRPFPPPFTYTGITADCEELIRERMARAGKYARENHTRFLARENKCMAFGVFLAWLKITGVCDERNADYRRLDSLLTLKQDDEGKPA
ncbi:MAG: hypothetical protein LBF93_04365 [Zoogloeaceae bacterium]|jgi:hypothetical protein|nr:hypothetical protein [Zoogloeaceae bacterium]